MLMSTEYIQHEPGSQGEEEKLLPYAANLFNTSTTLSANVQVPRWNQTSLLLALM